MPIYEYLCSNCEHEFEAIQKMSDEALTDCPRCHQPQLRKLISAAGFRLKGSGWYESDFKNKSKAKASAPADTAKKAAGSGSSSHSCAAGSCGCG